MTTVSGHGIVLLGIICLFFLSTISFLKSQPEAISDDRVSGSELGTLRDFWKETIEEKGGAEAYRLFLESTPANDIADTHTQAHVFGEALYTVSGIDGVAHCDSSFEFGCYHSFFGSAIYTEGIQALSLFDEACASAYAGENLPCQHGIGHGLRVYTGYEKLKDALVLCEEISWQPIGGCSSGVFMEYNFHTMESVGSGGYYVRPLESDPYEPCSTVSQKHKQACYFDQVQWWLSIYSRDYSRVAELCDGLKGDFQFYDACVRGIGNYLAADVDLEPTKIHQKCNEAMYDDVSNALCHEGASWLVRGDGSGVADALLVCEGLVGDFRSDCIGSITPMR